MNTTGLTRRQVRDLYDEFERDAAKLKHIIEFHKEYGTPRDVIRDRLELQTLRGKARELYTEMSGWELQPGRQVRPPVWFEENWRE
jgi:hypothetical protein